MEGESCSICADAWQLPKGSSCFFVAGSRTTCFVSLGAIDERNAFSSCALSLSLSLYVILATGELTHTCILPRLHMQRNYACGA